MLHTELIRPIPALLAEHRAQRGEKISFRDANRSATYRDLDERTRRLAGNLVALGVEPGHRVAFLLPNRVETAELYLATVRAGAVGVCLNAAERPEEIAFKLEDSGARVLVLDRRLRDLYDAVTSGTSGPEHIVVVSDEGGGDGAHAISYEDLATQEPTSPPPDDLSLDAPAWMLYTSGTTGRPKGVLLSQRGNLWVTAACWAPVLGLGADDEVLSPLPLFHSYALNLVIVSTVATGASVYLMERYSTKEVRRLLNAEPFTFFPGVPTMFHFLLDDAPSGSLGSGTLRVCVSAGAIMPAPLNQAFEDNFGVPLVDGYGITETSTMSTINWLTGTRTMGSCGLPLAGSTVRIVDPQTGEDQPRGSEGEIWVRGPHVMLGYHERPEETAVALEGGWYHTGDLARSDEHGYLTITGRIKELIIRGGENIAPAEIETVVVAHESVADAAVAGVPDDVYGEVAMAFVVPRDPATFDEDALREHCEDHLARYKVPAGFRVVEEVPRTGSGKVQRFKLRDRETG